MTQTMLAAQCRRRPERRYEIIPGVTSGLFVLDLLTEGAEPREVVAALAIQDDGTARLSIGGRLFDVIDFTSVGKNRSTVFTLRGAEGDTHSLRLKVEGIHPDDEFPPGLLGAPAE